MDQYDGTCPKTGNQARIEHHYSFDLSSRTTTTASTTNTYINYRCSSCEMWFLTEEASQRHLEPFFSDAIKKENDYTRFLKALADQD